MGARRGGVAKRDCGQRTTRFPPHRLARDLTQTRAHSHRRPFLQVSHPPPPPPTLSSCSSCAISPAECKCAAPRRRWAAWEAIKRGARTPTIYKPQRSKTLEPHITVPAKLNQLLAPSFPLDLQALTRVVTGCTRPTESSVTASCLFGCSRPTRFAQPRERCCRLVRGGGRPPQAPPRVDSLGGGFPTLAASSFLRCLRSLS